MFNSSHSTVGNTLPTVECVHDNKNFRCVEFVSNYDGDTITVNIPNVHPLIGSNAAVRLKGVDAPELRSKKPCEKKMAKKVRAFVYKKLKKAKTIELLGVQ
jgi:endonuclease YncB( thermonuclease family)